MQIFESWVSFKGLLAFSICAALAAIICAGSHRGGKVWNLATSLVLEQGWKSTRNTNKGWGRSAHAHTKEESMYSYIQYVYMKDEIKPLHLKVCMTPENYFGLIWKCNVLSAPRKNRGRPAEDPRGRDSYDHSPQRKMWIHLMPGLWADGTFRSWKIPRTLVRE